MQQATSVRLQVMQVELGYGSRASFLGLHCLCGMREK